MSWATDAFSFVLHLDTHLQQLCQHDGGWVYATLFAMVVVEASPLGMLFLPCDSMLFVSGALAAAGMLSPTLLLPTFIAAAVVADSSNYWLGRLMGRRLFANPQARVFQPAHLDKTDRFFARHGGKTIVVARFLPILRTYVPFASGAVRTSYHRFLSASALGASCWVLAFVMGGLLLGHLPVMRHHISPSVLGLVSIGLWPLLAIAWRWQQTRVPNQ